MHERRAGAAAARRSLRLVAAWVVAAAVVSAGCASTRIVSQWRDPEAGAAPFRKLVAVAIAESPSLRRVAEEELVAAAGADIAVPGYSVIPDEELRDREKAKARILASGADGVVVMRVVAEEVRGRWVQPSHYGSGWSYWGVVAPIQHSPGYYTEDHILWIESTAYRVPDGRILWSAQSESINPSDAEQLIDEVVELTVEAMREEGLLPQAE